MRRRKNFLFGGANKYEVNVYHYGKAHARGDRNVNTRKFSSDAQAMNWAKANLDYPEVEVVEIATGRVIFSGGTGKTFNPRKSRKRRAPRRRDAYAEMAKARKTTSGHKRKDRRRAVRKGSSRKAKHKTRFNPPEAHEQSTAETKIRNIFRKWSRALAAQGVKQEALPNLFDKDVKEQITKSAQVLVASQHPELRSEAMEGTPGVEVAQYILQLKPGGAFHKFQKKHGDVFTEGTMEVAEFVEQGRKGVAKVQKATARKVKKATKDAATAQAKKDAARLKALQAKEAALLAQLDDSIHDEEIPTDVVAELAEEFGDAERQVALAKSKAPKKKTQAPEFDEDEYEPEDFLRERKPLSQKRSERLGHYKEFLSPVRSSVRAPVEMLGKAREDVLLYRLVDGTTQVYMKGALTVAFEPSAKLASETIAHRYANRWRGLKPSGAVSPEAKKRRLATAVYLGVEGRSSLKLIEKPISLVKRGDKKADRKKYPMPDLDSYELKGDRANPRRTTFKYRVTGERFFQPRNQRFSFVVEATWRGKVNAVQKALAKKFRVPSIKLLLEQDDGEFEDSPLYTFESPDYSDIAGAITIEDAVSKNPRRRKNVGNLKGVISDKSFQIMIDGPVDRKYAVKIWDLKKDDIAYDGDWVHSSYQAARNYALRWLKMAPAKRPTWNPRRRKNLSPIDAEILSTYARRRPTRFAESAENKFAGGPFRPKKRKNHGECKVQRCHRKAKVRGLCAHHSKGRK